MEALWFWIMRPLGELLGFVLSLVIVALLVIAVGVLHDFYYKLIKKGKTDEQA